MKDLDVVTNEKVNVVYKIVFTHCITMGPVVSPEEDMYLDSKIKEFNEAGKEVCPFCGKDLIYPRCDW